MPSVQNSAAYQQALDFLYGRINYERSTSMPYHSVSFKLDRMRDLLARLGDPHLRYPAVHIAGTKGKGSTAAMVAQVLTAAGYRTGLYTSPHLDRLEERMAIDGAPCTAEQLVDLTGRVRTVVEQLDDEATASEGAVRSPTYFEITTATAMLHFAQQQVDIAVLEVGLGGRLDSTNVCRPLVTVITSISLDHTKQLGHTLSAIAREKAGIIKPSVPVVSGVRPAEPRMVVQDIARRQGCELYELDTNFDVTYQPPPPIGPSEANADDPLPPRATIHYRQRSPAVPHPERENLELAVLGRHQAANAALALATLDRLRESSWDIPEAAIRRGLAEVRLPARVEVISRRPTVVLDVAHNVASVQALLETLDESFFHCFPPRQRLLVFATTQGKDVRGMLRLLLPRFHQVVLTRYRNNPRSVAPARLARIATELCREAKGRGKGEGEGEGEGDGKKPGEPRQFPTFADPSVAWQYALAQASAEHLICVTGSFFIAAEIRALARSAVGGSPPQAPHSSPRVQ